MKRLILEFPNQKHLDAFVGQVSDGAMEDICTIEKIEVSGEIEVYEVKMNYVDGGEFDAEHYANHQYDGVDLGEDHDDTE